MKMSDEKHIIGGPLSLSVLEGLLRRKSPSFVDSSGLVVSPFTVTESNNRSRRYGPGTKLSRLNSIDDSFRLFEQVTVANRTRACTGLVEMKQEILALYGITNDVYDLIGSWRNNLLHGEQYWMDRLPIVLNMICLLVLDEIDPAVYDSQLTQIQNRLSFRRQSGIPFTPPWQVYPPDL